MTVEVYSTPPPAASPFLPAVLAERGLQEVHQYPLCLDANKRPVGRRSAAVAWADYPRIELQPPNAYAAILLDVDYPREAGWPGGKPAILPTWIVQADSGKMHVGYALQTPVHDNPDSRQEPLLKLANVADRLTYQLGGDLSYGGRITRNPLNPGPGVSTHFFSFAPYALDYLHRKLPKTRTRPGERLTGVGRKVDTFRLMVKEAHRPRWARLIAVERWDGEWLTYVRAENVRLWAPNVLEDRHCRSIAKSCAKYAMRNFSEAKFSNIQTRRNGRRWHGTGDFDFDDRDSKIVGLARAGFPQREIGDVVELSQPAVSRRLRALTVETPERKPWELQGISRSTWYRRRETNYASHNS